VLYTEPDKLAFFAEHLRQYIAVSRLGGGYALALAARSLASFQTYPRHQQTTESAINSRCGEVIGIAGDFSYGPFLMTRGLAEMTRLGVALGAVPATFAGLAGMGDLVLTCTGALSRNRSLGVEIGRGRTLAEILASRRTVAEGASTTSAALVLARRAGVEMPIAAKVSEVLYEGRSPRAAVDDLLARPLKEER
jgi:hypothetical protein